MKCNMGKTDRIIRIVLGLILLGWGLMNSCIIADIVGVILLATAAIGWCPLYLPLGINSGCESEKEEDKKASEEQ
ncbi:DUF2892 domain-containing protein [Sulfurovum sp.]|uniref:YgaP family membrane protein n=1 Tax=Sulfurovum sp. TaxID=1969726 RepID=UPI002A3639C5|nr:DUF2892 domain-containing protein [Sulfurovum sp.]MDD2451368.1 DUF2892 domain-containing protein [Sulfurovum sp.]MDD3499240.1 DUF2892 domain-containing protein [Sulfurovum sp.]MDY0402453.1 DUF2892 domain-containing protein [Sulfurovum sp.]